MWVLVADDVDPGPRGRPLTRDAVGYSRRLVPQRTFRN